MTQSPLPHALERVPDWGRAWRATGSLVLLLDFDGTLAPIVDRPDDAELPARTRTVLQRLLSRPGIRAAVVSGRGLEDARSRAGLPGIAYAGNHGMEIRGPDIQEVHAKAAAARPMLQQVLDTVEPRLAAIPGAIAEDKGLTLSIHYRMVGRDRVAEVQTITREATAAHDGLRITEGKEVLEVRPRVDWHKGRAVEFLLKRFAPPPGVPVLYFGDDTTDEDAFRVLLDREGGEGIRVADGETGTTAARSFVRDPGDVAQVLEALVEEAPVG
ncbi:MAG: trehalose-phosphatase [Gemmatimonadetes bacterium]|nr:trehalose-phosphatase [Gemmatimonadota bacterium]